MRTGVWRDFELRSPIGQELVASSAFVAAIWRTSRFPATGLLRIQQSLLDQVQVDQGTRLIMPMVCSTFAGSHDQFFRASLAVSSQ